MPTADDHVLAASAASSAGVMLHELRGELFSGRQRHYGWPEEQADEAGHHFLMDLLHEERPDDGILSEEGNDGRNRLDFDRVWIVDPLDGSSGYGRGDSDWAVHVALTEGGKPIAGAVSLPEAGTVFSTKIPPAVPDRRSGKPIVITGRSRAHLEGRMLAHELDAELISCGSAGVKAMLVVMGEADVYVHASPLYEWDVCAPAAVAKAAGLHVSAANGKDLIYNQPRPVVPGLVICRPEFAGATLDALGF